jgi:hypothetical protein
MTTAIPAGSRPPSEVRSSTNSLPPKTDPVSAPAKAPATSATISPAALAALATSKEAAETPAQTAQEARGNDHQAQRLLAKEAAARKAYS